MSKVLRLSALSMALTSMAAAPMAATLQVNAVIDGSGYLSSGLYSSIFDATTLLPSAFQINSASFSFVFQDDADVLGAATRQLVSQSTTEYTYIGRTTAPGVDGNNEYHSYYSRNRTSYFDENRQGEREGVQVSLGGLSVGGGETAGYSSSENSLVYDGQVLDSKMGHHGYYYSYSCGNRCVNWAYQPGSWTYYHTNEYSQTTSGTQDWYGQFVVGGDVTDAGVLGQLLLNRQLSFDLLVNGDLNLIGASLLLDITEIQTPVPEPGSIGLALAGLAGLAASRRRRRVAD